MKSSKVVDLKQLDSQGVALSVFVVGIECLLASAMGNKQMKRTQCVTLGESRAAGFTKRSR